MAIKKENNKMLIVIIIVVSVLLIGSIITGFVLLKNKNVKNNNVTKTEFIKKDDVYKAVFLLNNQVYFGKIESENNNKLVLNNVYYLQVNQQEETTKGKTESQPQTSLVKLGEEIHGPENRLEIMNQNVLFIETLRKDSKILEAIGNYERQGTLAPQK